MICDLIPDADALLALEPEELAGPVLHVLSLLNEYDQDMHRGNFLGSHSSGYAQEQRKAVEHALVEAWMWLEREGLIAPRPTDGEHGWYFVTRRGREVGKANDLPAYRRANMLPRHLLHGRIAQKVWATFLRGDYDTAIFQAFKEVEVAVREAAEYGEDKYGTNMMQAAFAPGKTGTAAGPLTDVDAPLAEQRSMMFLFTGAIGHCKNPTSHRHVGSEPAEAVELIVFASHLLRIIDRRAPK